MEKVYQNNKKIQSRYWNGMKHRKICYSNNEKQTKIYT